MRDLVQKLVESAHANRPVACCRLVETRGSTPQKAGATMLVFEDGAQAGTLGGGCVEAEVKRRSLEILAKGQPEVIVFQLDNDYGWDDGLICGGRMTVLVDPVTTPAAASYYERLRSTIVKGQGLIEAIVFDADKSGAAAPACYLFDEDDRLLAQSTASAGGDQPPAVVLEGRPSLVDRPRPLAAQGVAYLPILSRCRLLIVGGGHVGQAVGNLAADLDFDTWIVDDRPEYVSAARFPRAQRLLSGDIAKILAELAITSNDYLLIVTRGHNHDEEALYHLVDRGARYVGMIGSRRKIKLIFDDLEVQGISREALARVHAPVGIEIGSQTVMEIAVSILAELVSHRNLRGEIPGRPAPVLDAT